MIYRVICGKARHEIELLDGGALRFRGHPGEDVFAQAEREVAMQTLAGLQRWERPHLSGCYLLAAQIRGLDVGTDTELSRDALRLRARLKGAQMARRIRAKAVR